MEIRSNKWKKSKSVCKAREANKTIKMNSRNVKLKTSLMASVFQE